MSYSSISTDLQLDIVFASFESGGEQLRERIGDGILHARRPRLVRLIAEEHVALVQVNGPGDVGLVHLASLEAELGVLIDGGGEALRFSGHSGAGRRLRC